MFTRNLVTPYNGFILPTIRDVTYVRARVDGASRMRTLASCTLPMQKNEENTWLGNLWLRAQGDFNITWIVTGPKMLGYHTG